MKSSDIVCQLFDIGKDINVNVRSYSGRAMYGKHCVAITGELKSCQQALSSLIIAMYDGLLGEAEDLDEHSSDELVLDYTNRRNDMDNVVRQLLTYRQDSMGLQVVLYWPELSWDNDCDKELDDEH